jgi:hypothetical protein
LRHNEWIWQVADENEVGEVEARQHRRGCARAGFDNHAGANVALFGAVSEIARPDWSRIGTARGGPRVAFCRPH